MKPTYFTCTLGQASDLGLTDKSFQNINCFIEARAKSAPNDPAVGFAIPSASETKAWSSSTWTFAEVFQGSRTLASVIYKKHGKQLGQSRTVALICPSTPEFLFIWLALMRLGHAVLLVAPQCQPAAIAHLCKACDVSLIFHDDVYTSQCHEAAETALRDGVELSPTSLPFTKDLSLAVLLKQSAGGLQHEPDILETDVAYLHHTSGTSSGVPKPIPQTHRAGAGVLPAFPDGREAASFTTTPLYHGGVADLFRAWASGALIWLFPGKGVPITARNICKSLDASTKCSTNPPIKYFSSVPYVLPMMEADERGLSFLRSMNVVGVGGAALPTEVGDRMVKQGINLISRFGSAECGFLMSSHRDYENDQDWQYLRSAEGMSFFKFEEREGGLSELVIAQGWPHMVFPPETFIFRSIMKRPLTCGQAKTNRSDGSYATADLFAPHKTIPNAWRYDSRADSQLTLITGKKFDPAPLEGAISTSELLEDVLIFGNGRPFPGALLFRSEAARNMPDADLREALLPLIERLNIESQDHARIPSNMVIPLPVLATPLEKSSKGTIIRGATEARFSVAIDSAYNDMSSFNVINDVPDEDLPRLIKKMITSIVPKRGQLDDDTDLFAYGVDSVAGMQIRNGLRQLLPGSASKQLPLNVVEDCGTVARLADYVIRQRNGDQTVDEEDEHQFMLQLVEDYSNFQRRPVGTLSNGESDDDIQRHQDKQTDNKKDVIVLTGATGALGAHVLALYCQKPSVRKIYCLVRGTDAQIAKDRIDQALKQRGLRELPPQDAAVEIEILPASLGEERLGLSDRDYERMAKEITIVMHVAWSVNFRMRLRSFVKDNISGLTNLINLALLSSSGPSPAKFAYCSSIASVQEYRGEGATIPEEILDDPAVSSSLGYSRSKWVAEQICARAGKETSLRGRIGVFRVGQLAGDRSRGVWNTKEAWPIMLSSVKLTRTLPALDETLDWLPVDVAAEALTQGIDGVGGSGETVDVLHVLNKNRVPKWGDLLVWLKEEKAFDIIGPAEWVARLEDAQETDVADHPAFKLLGLWKRAYFDGSPVPENGVRDEMPHSRTPDLLKTEKTIPCLRDVKPLDKGYVLKLWRWIDHNM